MGVKHRLPLILQQTMKYIRHSLFKLTVHYDQQNCKSTQHSSKYYHNLQVAGVHQCVLNPIIPLFSQLRIPHRSVKP